jgi:hypothetical protein
MHELEFSELKVGMKVQDEDGDFGIIIKIKDINNIVVKYETGTKGWGFYCLKPYWDNYNDILYNVE